MTPVPVTEMRNPMRAAGPAQIIRMGRAVARRLGGKRRRRRKASTEIPSIRDGLRALIVRALQVDYDSQLGKRGNRYQTVVLGDVEVRGMRTDRAEILDQVDFAGKKVLDLGCNVGEVSRAVRARGAALVDGYEIDPFFVEVAGAINVYRNETRVSFFQRDISDKSCYAEHYDIVLAFSVWAFLDDVLDRIAGVTDQLLIVETHELNQGPHVDQFPGAPPSPSSVHEYLAAVSGWFPAYRILGRTDRERRAIIAFARDEATLAAGLRHPDSHR